MTDQTNATNFRDDARLYWNQLRAIDLCRAISRTDNKAADAIIAEVTADNEPLHLVAGLAHAAGSLVKTLAQLHPDATEDQIWRSLTDRSLTGLHATRELIRMTNTTEGEN